MKAFDGLIKRIIAPVTTEGADLAGQIRIDLLFLCLRLRLWPVGRDLSVTVLVNVATPVRQVPELAGFRAPRSVEV